ncbi:hypothetical protein BJ742DRAFT_678319 [Cladochytrium replicatum]|nr:hypothetical protein BJ742DRAFT_678319 [Cladochytrium replicatum]
MAFKVVVVGGGLVGSLAAVLFSKRGWSVEVYEARRDLRTDPNHSGRSINLALSVRGIAALKAAGVDTDVLGTVIPMKGRMIHSVEGKQSSQPYGLFGECINSVDRKKLNERLVTAGEKQNNVKFYFEHELIKANFSTNVLVFERSDGKAVEVKADLILGADGAHSRIRGFLQSRNRMYLEQHFIDHSYMELTILPNMKGDFALDPNHLHIWPRHSYMMIALPNLDKTFTVTLFMPSEIFDSLQTDESIVEFFQTNFRDAYELIGKENLLSEYRHNPQGSLVYLKCAPYHLKNKVVIVGDAAHAMVPFYGQGMNCGFEDMIVLTDALDASISDTKNPTPAEVEKALDAYSKNRAPDAHAIVDLALQNYVEMRDSVVRWSYLFRKSVEGFIYKRMPKQEVVVPLYTMVSFTRTPYKVAYDRYKRNSKVFDFVGLLGSGFGVTAAVGLAVFAARKYNVLQQLGISLSN